MLVTNNCRGNHIQRLVTSSPIFEALVPRSTGSRPERDARCAGAAE